MNGVKEISNDKWSFFKNQDNVIEYNSKCLECKNKCKQSFRATIICCKKYNK